MDAERKTAGQQMDALFNQFPAMFKTAPGEFIDAAQEGSPHAARDAVIDAGSVWVDQM
jgi:hypothetical protein